MATWQFDFHLVPTSSVDRHFRVVPVTISEDDYDAVSWWKGFQRASDLENDLTRLLAPRHSWHPSIKTWGREDGDRFDVTQSEQGLEDVYGRLDVRHLSLPFLNEVVEIARRNDLMIITEDRRVLRPSVKELLAAISNSRSFAYVGDPESFLSRLTEDN